MQHWEFASLPRAWIEPMRHHVDEIWVASQSVRQCYLDSGISAEQVHVIPLGIDPSCFHPQAPPLSLRTRKRFRFLFVGGTIYRKGIDLLLDAYAQAFTAADDVCLVIKDMGVGTFYRGQTVHQRIAQLQNHPGAPAIEYIDRPLTETEMAGLYTACQCLAHPYRGEGFGLPLAEAMACGLPVIVTGMGAALGFCNEANAYLIPARRVQFPEKRVGDLQTVDYPWLAEPDGAVLRTLLRQAFEQREEARSKGAAGCQHIQRHFTWEQTARAVEQRITALRHRQPRRFGKEAAATERSVTATKPGTARVSACIIVKNEESNLPGCLDSILGLANEIIVVDTGSTDRTKEIARQYGAKVFDFAWVDSFAAARNECLRHATGDWIFWMDADDCLDETNRQKLLELFAGLRDDKLAYVMQCLCLPDPETGVATGVQHVRLFRNHPQIRWEHRIHEQILPAVRRWGGELHYTDIVIQHTGYADPALRQRKRERDLRLLLQEHAEQPDHPFTLFNLGMTYLDGKRPADALPLLERSLALSQPSDSIVRKLYYLIVQCHRQQDQKAEALAVCQRGRAHHPQDAELLSQEAQLRGEQGDFTGAEACYVQLLASREGPHLASVPIGLNGYRTRHNLGALYYQKGLKSSAEEQWRLAVAEQPDFLPSWLALEQLFISQGRWADLEWLAQQLERQPTHAAAAAGTRARVHLARKEYAAARRLLENAIRQAPHLLRLRLLLSDVLVEQGADWPAAERALRSVLEVDPNQPDVQRNLTILQARIRDHSGP